MANPPKYLSPLPAIFQPKKAATLFDDKKRKALLQKLEKDKEKEREEKEKELKKARKEKKKADIEALISETRRKLDPLHKKLSELIVRPDLILMEAIGQLCEHADVDAQVRVFRKIVQGAGTVVFALLMSTQPHAYR